MDFLPHLISTRNLISALADRFHIISPDYPGFGNSDMPDRSKFVYTFDKLAEIVEGLLKQISFFFLKRQECVRIDSIDVESYKGARSRCK